jgi:MYXO-CTERM domain-containing protein
MTSSSSGGTGGGRAPSHETNSGCSCRTGQPSDEGSPIAAIALIGLSIGFRRRRMAERPPTLDVG